MEKLILNEQLFEGKQLKEDLSPTMPKWLKNRLLFVKPNRAYKRGANRILSRNKYANQGYDMDQRNPGYSGRSGNVDLFQGFLNAGIDLSKVNVIEDSIPSSVRDPRLKPPYYPIFLFDAPTGFQVYAKGINDNEIFENDPKNPYNQRKFGYVPAKELLANAKAFCYIDSTDTSNLFNDRMPARNEYKAWNDPWKRYSEDELGWGQNIDKSGYLIDPHKFDKALAEMGRKDIQKTLDKFYTSISNIKHDFANLLVDTDIADMSDNYDYNKVFGNSYYGLFRKLSDIISSYNALAAKTKEALNETDAAYRESLLDNLYSKNGSYGNIKSSIKNLEKEAESVLSVDLDWE